MLLKYGTAVALFLAATGPAFADACGSAPVAPAAVDGSAATEAQMKSAHDDVVNFIKASDDFQACVLADLKRQRMAAAKKDDAKPLDPAIEAAAQGRVSENQRVKEKVGGEYNTAVAAYKAKHPG